MNITVKVILIGVAFSLYGAGLFVASSGIASWWVVVPLYSVGGCVWLFAMLAPLKRKERLTMTPTLPPPGFPQGFQVGALISNAFGPGPGAGMPLAQLAQMQAEVAAEPEPEGEPRTLVGLTGWRIATVASVKPLVLVGVAGGHVVGRYSEPASCDQGGKHEAPAWSCRGKASGCGYYVLNDPPLSEGAVLVKVSLAGRTIRCDGGYRTFRYRLEEIWLPPAIAANTNIEEAEERFGVPIYVLERMMPDGDRAKKGSHNLHTTRDADTGPAEERANVAADEGS